MNFSTHPLGRHVRHYPLHSEERRNAERMAGELAARFAALAALTPGDPAALDALKRTSALAHSIHQAYGPIHGWTLEQFTRVYHEAVRLLGPLQTDITPPSWTEAF